MIGPFSVIWTVLIVDQDQSRSVNIMMSDVPGHRSRSRSVFYNITNELIATPLLQHNMVPFTDVATTVFVHPLVDRALMTWEVYNVFVGLAKD
jgi:hypothetical protein